MALTLEQVQVLIKAETGPYKKALEDIKNQTANAQKEVTQKVNGLNNTFSKLGNVIKIAAITGALYKVGQYGTQMALEVSAAMNQIRRTMGESSQSFLKWANNGAIAYNIAKGDAIKYGAVYSNLFSNFIKDNQQLTGYTVKMLETSSIIASATGRTMDDVMNRIRSGMLGSTEAIEDLGINVNVAMLEATEAFQQLANGRSWAQLDFNTQQAIRMMAILEQATKKYGNTLMQGPTTSLAYFVALLKNSALNIGNAFLPVLNAIMPALNTFASFLNTATSALATFTQLLFGKTVNTSGGLGGAMSDVQNSAGGIADSLGDAGNGAGKLGDGIGKAGKAAKQAAKEMLGLLKFDEINSLKKQSDNGDDGGGSGGGGGGGGGGRGGGNPGGGALTLPKVSFSDSFNEEDSGPIVKFLEKLKELLQPTIEALERLAKALEPLKEFVAQALIDFYEHFLVPVGTWVLGEGLPRFIDIITKTLNNIDFPKINEALRQFWDALAPFSITIGEGLLWFLDNVMSPLVSYTISDVVPEFIRAVAGAVSIADGILRGAGDAFAWLFDSFLSPIAQWTGGIAVEVLKRLADALQVIGEWCKNNTGVISTITKVLGAFFGVWKTMQFVAYIQQLGGLSGAFTLVVNAVKGLTIDKIASFGESLYLTALYAKDFILNSAQLIWSLVTQAAQWVISAGSIALHTAASTAAAAATWLLNGALAVLTSPITLVIAAIAALVAVGLTLIANWDTVAQVASDVWQGICDFIGGVCASIGQFFAGLWQGMTAIFSQTGQWFGNMFKQAWDNIVNIFKPFGQWFGQRWQDVVNALNGIATWFGNMFRQAWTLVTGIFAGIGSWFGARWHDVVGVLSGVASWFGNIFSSAFSAVKNAFSGIGAFFSGVWSTVQSIFVNAGQKIGSAVGGAFRYAVNAVLGTIENVVNGFIGMINGVIGLINKIPGVSLGSIGYVNLPRLAKGGIIDSATLAIVGEAGKEAVMPLENNTVWITDLASKVADRMPQNSGGGSNGPVIKEIVVQIGDKEFGRFAIDEINKAHEQAGRLLLNI